MCIRRMRRTPAEISHIRLSFEVAGREIEYLWCAASLARAARSLAHRRDVVVVYHEYLEN